MTASSRLALGGAIVLVGAAIAKEYAAPAGERTGQGTVVGIPYDLRRPSIARVRETWWDPDNEALIVPRAFGIGWAINVARLIDIVAKRRHS